MLTGYKFCHENIKRSFFWEFLPLSFGYRDKFSQSFSLTEKNILPTLPNVEITIVLNICHY